MRMTVYLQQDWERRQQRLILNQEYGYMIAMKNNKIIRSSTWQRWQEN